MPGSEPDPAETQLASLARSHGRMGIHCPRLPRIATDQNLSFTSEALPDPAAMLLPKWLGAFPKAHSP